MDAGAEEAEAALPEDVVSGEDAMAGEMETESSGQATEMPAPDCSEGGGDEDTGAEVLETVTEAQDLPGSTLDTAADTGVEEGSVQEPGSSTGGQSVGHKCSVCLKTFKHKGTTSISRLISMESS